MSVVSIRAIAKRMRLDTSQMTVIAGHLIAPSECGGHLYQWSKDRFLRLAPMTSPGNRSKRRDFGARRRRAAAAAAVAAVTV